eukprot:scaffold2262_cov303-Alexandrium_tamarense.AAC.3
MQNPTLSFGAKSAAVDEQTRNARLNAVRSAAGQIGQAQGDVTSFSDWKGKEKEHAKTDDATKAKENRDFLKEHMECLVVRDEGESWHMSYKDSQYGELSSDEGKNEGMSDDEQKKPKMLLRKRSNKVNP